ncbi:hypothetical protein [Streptomyces sp. NPDC001070]
MDKSDHVLPQVKVSTVYGGDRGNMAVPYGGAIDILRFSGPGKHDVADVRVTVQSTTTARIGAGPHEVTARAPLDSHGREITEFERFSAVRLTNEDDSPVAVRIAHILWDQPPKGVTRQAAEVTPMGGLTRVPSDCRGGTQLQRPSSEAFPTSLRAGRRGAVTLAQQGTHVPGERKCTIGRLRARSPTRPSRCGVSRGAIPA